MNEPKFSESSENSEDENLDELRNAYLLVRDDLRSRSLGEGSYAESLGFYSELYQPDSRLIQRINDYNKWYIAKKSNDKTGIAQEDAGQLMEEIAFLAFSCLKDVHHIESYQSFDAQLDLLVTVNSIDLSYEILNLKGEKILVEAKNHQTAISVKDFSRLCHLVQYKFPDQCYLGVFFTREGASGFPNPEQDERQSSIQYAKAIQVIFHAQTLKYVIVLSHTDIQQLQHPGGLFRVLKGKMQEVEDSPGIFKEYTDDKWIQQPDLPNHLKKYTDGNNE